MEQKTPLSSGVDQRVLKLILLEYVMILLLTLRSALRFIMIYVRTWRHGNSIIRNVRHWSL